MRTATLTRRSLAFLALVLAAGCTGGMPAVTGTPAVAPADAAELKTGALHGALAEIARSTGNGATVYGVYLDTLIGPTPEAYIYSWTHPREWLEAMVATKLVDGLFGVGGAVRGMRRTGVAIEVGEPYPAGRDTLTPAGPGSATLLRSSSPPAPPEADIRPTKTKGPRQTGDPSHFGVPLIQRGPRRERRRAAAAFTFFATLGLR